MKKRIRLLPMLAAVLVLAVLCAAPAFAESGAQDEPGSRMVECAECGGSGACMECLGMRGVRREKHLRGLRRLRQDRGGKPVLQYGMVPAAAAHCHHAGAHHKRGVFFTVYRHCCGRPAVCEFQL